MRVRWLRLLVDEGHELGGHETVRSRADAHSFIAGLPAERRWVISGTPVAGARNMDVLSVRLYIYIYLNVYMCIYIYSYIYIYTYIYSTAVSPIYPRSADG